MQINISLNLQTKQVMSQAQVQSLNILAMSMTELQEYLQKEEIENPIIESLEHTQSEPVTVTYQEYSYISAKRAEHTGMGSPMVENSVGGDSIEDMIFAQLPWNQLESIERKIIEFCINSLDHNGFLSISQDEIAEKLQAEVEEVTVVLSMLKRLEPQGIFSANLEECLLSQVNGMEEEELLKRLIHDHLEHIAEGKLSTITRALKISSTDARRLIHTIKKLNPRPLNGYGDEQTQYIVPDILMDCKEGQWTISLNDKWTGSFGINEFYVRMMEATQDTELKDYFEEKLRRARFIMNAVEQRRKTILAISKQILVHQEKYLLGQGGLKPMSLERIAEECEIHKSTVSRAIREKYLLAPRGCVAIRDLFTTGVSSSLNSDEGISRNVVKDKLRELVDSENKEKPYSDDALAELLKQKGISISRRTVAKYRGELGIPGVFQRKEV